MFVTRMDQDPAWPRWISANTSAARAPAKATFAGEGVTVRGLPTDWGAAGNAPEDYVMDADNAVEHGGQASAHMKCIAEKAQGFGTLMQEFKADVYRGKRLRLSAWMKTEKADSAQLWMRLDGEKEMLGFDDNRAVKGTTEWKKLGDEPKYWLEPKGKGVGKLTLDQSCFSSMISDTLSNGRD